MASKEFLDAMLDLQADDLIANGNLMVLCSAHPTDYNDAVNVVDLADVALVGGDYTKAAGDVDGRKVTIAEQLAVPVDHNGIGTHVVIVDTVGVVIKAVTTCTNVDVSAGGTVDLPAWKITLRDPT